MSTDDRILDAAMRVFEEVGLRGATTRRIAEEAGVNEVTLFRRFGSKEQLMLEAMRRTEEGHVPLPEHPVEPARELLTWCRDRVEALQRKRLLIRSTMNEIDAHPEVCAAAHRKPIQVFNELAAYLERVRAAGLGCGEWDAHLAARMLMGSLFAEAVFRPVIPEEVPRTPVEITDCFVELFVRAIGARPLVPSRDPSEGTSK
jgi:AcrR family transcriptional regulator